MVCWYATIEEEEAAVDAKLVDANESKEAVDAKVAEKKPHENGDEEPVTVGTNLEYLYRSLDAAHQFGGGACKLFIRQWKVVTIACHSNIGKFVVFCPCLVPSSTA